MKDFLPVKDYQKLLFLKGEENIEGDGFQELIRSFIQSTITFEKILQAKLFLTSLKPLLEYIHLSIPSYNQTVIQSPYSFLAFWILLMID